jgi:UDP-2,3-diacylglucosamine pyrophosphatase LpxH
MKKEIIVFGDIEMGAGNLTDDFISDQALSKVILELSRKKHPIDLILNGDTFDFLKCPSRLQPSTVYPRHITKKISLQKLNLMYEAHTQVFEALKKFVSKKGKLIYFIIGNHDHDLVYPEVRDQIKNYLGNSSQIIFPGFVYTQHGVRVEHGHQYDFLFSINFEKFFLKHKGESILNMPYITFGLISTFMRGKEENPFLERIFPRPALLTHHRIIARKLNLTTISYFLKSMLYYPFRYYSDPTYSFPTNMLRELYKRIRTVHWDVDNIASVVLKNKKIKNRIIVLGHVHEKRLSKGKNRVVINPGSWRDEYDFNSKTRELYPRVKRYVQIIVHDDGKLQYKLIDTSINRSIYDFDEVLRHERKYLKLAAKEENYKLHI